MPSALLEPNTKGEPETERSSDTNFVAIPVEPGPVLPIRDTARHEKAFPSRGIFLVRSSLRLGLTLVLVAVLIDELTQSQAGVPSIVLRRIVVTMIVLVLWLVCSWRGFRNDYASNFTRNW